MEKTSIDGGKGRGSLNEPTFAGLEVLKAVGGRHNGEEPLSLDYREEKPRDNEMMVIDLMSSFEWLRITLRLCTSPKQAVASSAGQCRTEKVQVSGIIDF
jgi:hypothetical protein